MPKADAEQRRTLMLKILRDKGPCTVRYLVSRIKTCHSDYDDRKAISDIRLLKTNRQLWTSKVTDLKQVAEARYVSRGHAQKIMIVSV